MEEEKKTQVNYEIKDIGIEELLHNLRTEKNLSYLELAVKLNNEKITEKTVKKWEKGLEYPDLDTIYLLSKFYHVASQDFIQAKNNSFSKGFGGVNMELIKWICYFLDITLKTSIVMLYTIILVLLIVSFMFFITMCMNVDKSQI